MSKLIIVAIIFFTLFWAVLLIVKPIILAVFIVLTSIVFWLNTRYAKSIE
ncbi:hypothetical protein [Pedobacter suwonensis]|nr:hypothetical protein [Pedobacter suwonensis]